MLNIGIIQLHVLGVHLDILSADSKNHLTLTSVQLLKHTLGQLQ